MLGHEKYMFQEIKDYIKGFKLEKIKPFGSEFTKKAVSFSICGYTKEIAYALKNQFEHFDQVEIIQGDIFKLNCDALVSPANSIGDMSGGLDKAIDDFYKGEAQKKAFQIIKAEYFGELPVGCAVPLEMKTKNFNILIISPTMRIPGNVSSTINAYLSMRALLIAIAKYNMSNSKKITSVAIPSLCTGVGGMPYEESAKQMRIAFENIVGEKWMKVAHPAMAPYAF